MRRALAAALLAAAVTLALIGVAGSGLFAPARPAGDAQVVEVHKGETLLSVARRLEKAELLPQRPLFGPRVLVTYGRIRGLDRELKCGEYDLSPSLTPVEILERIVAGAVKTHPITLPEGLRLDELAPRLEAAGILSAQSFLERARDPIFTRSLGIEADSLEGYLYPETYRFRRDSSAQEVLERMVGELRSRWEQADTLALERSGFSLHEALTLASIVEKETAVAEERRRIAAVFRNRIARGMRLQSDPTVIYGIVLRDGSFDGNLRQRDLQSDTPYNTYTRAGLPPGPIAATTLESVRAVLDPEASGYLYFVSRNDGTHHFSKSLTEHNSAVQRYQKRAPAAPEPG